MIPDSQSGSECRSVYSGVRLELGPPAPSATLQAPGPRSAAVCRPGAACPRCCHPVPWVPVWEEAVSV